jgi:quinolinate synthase
MAASVVLPLPFPHRQAKDEPKVRRRPPDRVELANVKHTEKTFEPVRDEAVCEYMKMTTLTKPRDSLRDGRYEVSADNQIAARAQQVIERMIMIS